MRSHLLCRSLLLLSLSFSAFAKDAAEVELALTAMGAGSAVEIKSRLCTDRITTFNTEARAQAIAALPVAVRDHRVTDGKLLRRVEPLLNQVLQLHGRTRASQQPELFLFQHEMPTAQIWRGCVLLLSTSLAEALYDGELAGICAHALSHAYFEDEMAAAQHERDERALRIVELKCDGVAVVSVQLLGYKPTWNLSGLQRIQLLTKRLGRSSSILQSHPEMVLRAQFSQRFINYSFQEKDFSHPRSHPKAHEEEARQDLHD